jgi:hypothetical protein
LRSGNGLPVITKISAKWTCMVIAPGVKANANDLGIWWFVRIVEESR